MTPAGRSLVARTSAKVIADSGAFVLARTITVFPDVMTGATKTKAEKEVTDSVDRLVWYAGWTDKIASLAGSTNPVAGPFYNFTIPESVGVVAAIAPESPSLLGLIDIVAPVTFIISSTNCPRRPSSISAMRYKICPRL